jgi:hypothetical protein
MHRGLGQITGDDVRIVLDLTGDDERALIRLVRALLKTLGRRFKVKCNGVKVET